MTANLLTVLPTPLTEALMRVKDSDPWLLCQQLERDCMTLALLLYADRHYSFSPATAEVMDRWRPGVEALLYGNKK